MDLGALTHQQLLRIITFSAAGSMISAVLFVVALVLNVRKFRRQFASDDDDDAMDALPPKDGGDHTMSLLKSYGKNDSSLPQSARSPTPSREPVELMRVLIDPDTQKIFLEVDGVRFDDLSAVPDRTTGQRILESAAAVLKFTRGIIVTANGTKSIPVPNVTISRMPVSAPPTPISPAEEPTPTISQDVLAVRKQFLADLEAQAKAARTPNTAALSSRSRWGLGKKKPLAKAEATVEVSAFNLAEQIDDILQKKWDASGLATEMKIHSVPGGGIRIQVGRNFYDSVDDVEETAARELIKSAIKTWEAQ